MPKQITKNQHYISQSYLKHFANSEEKLFEVLLNTKKIYPTSISSSMCETYTYEDEKLPVNTVENYFINIEGKVASLVKDLITSIEKVKTEEINIEISKKIVEDLLGRFLVFYYRSGALLTEFSSINKKDKIPLLSDKILNFDYINKLAESIKTFYKFAIIESSDDFLLSDQFISTSALKIKTQFFDLSNRHIGLNETLLLIPISSSYYIVYWNTKSDFIFEEDKINLIDEEKLKLINNTVINNSYVKCVAKKPERIKEVLEDYKMSSPTQIYAGGNPPGYSMGAIKKKEVFFYPEERKAWQLLEFMTMMSYKSLGRNDKCACNSDKKFKNCHLDAYIRIKTVMQTFGRSDSENIRDFFIWGITTIERPIDQWSGYSDLKN